MLIDDGAGEHAAVLRLALISLLLETRRYQAQRVCL